MTNELLMKIAGRAADALGYTVGLGMGLPTPIGAVMGMADDPASKEQVGAMVDSNKGILPGVGAYNMEQINNRVAKDYEEATGNKSSRNQEIVGKHSSTLLLAALGALLGGAGGFYLNRKDVEYDMENAMKGSPEDDFSWETSTREALPAYMIGGAGLGAAAGGLTGALANILGGGAAAVTGTRTKEEQDAAEQHGIKNLLVPGLAEYNDWKRLGHGYDKYQQAHNKVFAGANVRREL